MKDYISERVITLAEYIIDKRATVRDAAGKFGISKSTVHIDMTQRLPRLNHSMWTEVKEILDENKAERHIRGGMSTRNKYKNTKKERIA